MIPLYTSVVFRTFHGVLLCYVFLSPPLPYSLWTCHHLARWFIFHLVLSRPPQHFSQLQVDAQTFFFHADRYCSMTDSVYFSFVWTSIKEMSSAYAFLRPERYWYVCAVKFLSLAHRVRMLCLIMKIYRRIITDTKNCRSVSSAMLHRYTRFYKGMPPH